LLWFLDGLLQAQPFMFTRGFATRVIAPAGQGQPGFVADPLHAASTVIAAQPVAWNAAFVAVQLLIGAGLLLPRTARPALAASIAWALGVWYFGEGLSGLASGHASLITGAPGSALILALLAGAAWPERDGEPQDVASWLPLAWAVVWVGAAVFQAMPGQESVNAAHDGTLPVVLLVAAEYLIGVGALARRTRLPAVALGLALTLAFWVLGQDLGQLDSGQATDPNVGPVLALMAVALLLTLRPYPQGRSARTAPSGRRRPVRNGSSARV
jgi:hypothetical protein